MNTLTADDLAQRLAELLQILGYDNTPLDEPGEIGAVDWFAAESLPNAETYVQRRLAYALKRLTDPFATGKPVEDARIALGAHAYLLELQGGSA